MSLNSHGRGGSSSSYSFRTTSKEFSQGDLELRKCSDGKVEYSSGGLEIQATDRNRLNVLFQNPLAYKTRNELMREVEMFCEKYDLMNDLELFKKGALIAQAPHEFGKLEILSSEEKQALVKENTNKWSQPFSLYGLCSKQMILISLYSDV